MANTKGTNDNKNKRENQVTEEEDQQKEKNMTEEPQKEPENAGGKEQPEKDVNTEDEQTGEGGDNAKKIAQLEQDIEESKDKYLRLFSEFENYKRRTTRQQADMVKTANEELMGELLPVLDDFERSLNNIKESEAGSANYEGIELVYHKFKKILEQKGLQPMDIQPGSEFDSEYQEAVAQTPAPDESYKNKVVDVIEQGYFLGDKVLRFAKVVTGS